MGPPWWTLTCVKIVCSVKLHNKHVCQWQSSYLYLSLTTLYTHSLHQRTARPSWLNIRGSSLGQSFMHYSLAGEQASQPASNTAPLSWLQPGPLWMKALYENELKGFFPGTSSVADPTKDKRAGVSCTTIAWSGWICISAFDIKILQE